MKTKIGVIINMDRAVKLGLEIYRVSINGVIAAEYLSRELAATKFKTLIQKYNK